MQSKKQAIGIFDSGIGGLTVANAIQKLLPNERIVYFGDTAHLPYGDKSAKAIQHYAKGISHFLLGKDCKMVVVACNTASAVAFNEVKKACGRLAIPINVIDPVVKELGKQQTVKKVGVIATKRTVSTRVYTKRILKSHPELLSTELATPLLAPMIEEGFFNNKISQTIINSYLAKKNLDNIDALILACTHYPLIQKEIENYYKGKVQILDSAHAVALAVQQELTSKKLLSDNREGEHEFYVSDFTESFEQTARIFFPEEIHLREMNLWA
ncbi:MAG: glutamate racemase [Bacteroidetes bacterium]|nr:MAG: glutamate racemase [Bacteroidota bacterium]